MQHALLLQQALPPTTVSFLAGSDWLAGVVLILHTRQVKLAGTLESVALDLSNKHDHFRKAPNDKAYQVRDLISQKVDLHKSTPPRIRQLIIYYY